MPPDLTWLVLWHGEVHAEHGGVSLQWLVFLPVMDHVFPHMVPLALEYLVFLYWAVLVSCVCLQGSIIDLLVQYALDPQIIDLGLKDWADLTCLCVEIGLHQHGVHKLQKALSLALHPRVEQSDGSQHTANQYQEHDTTGECHPPRECALQGLLIHF